LDVHRRRTHWLVQRGHLHLRRASPTPREDPFAYFEWVFEKLMHHPVPEELQALLPVNWIKTRPVASQTIESQVA
jgi:hypothetical protein